MRPSDIPALEAMATASGFPYPDLNDAMIEAVMVILDEEDRPVMACAAKRILELYLYCGDLRPHAKLSAVRAFHQEMPEMLRAKGYNEVNAFIPDTVAAGFKRKLVKMFGWCENIPSLFWRF